MLKSRAVRRAGILFSLLAPTLTAQPASAAQEFTGRESSMLPALLPVAGTLTPRDTVRVTEADMCAVIEPSVTRLGNDVGEPGEVEQAAALASTLGEAGSVAFRQRRLTFRGRWGRCRVSVPPGSFGSRLETVRFSADGRFAVVSGGWIAGTLLGSGGECYFRKPQAQWLLVGCRNTWSV